MTVEFKYRQFARALYLALVEDAFYIAMEESSSKEAMIRYMEYSMAEAERYGRLDFCVGNDHGAAIWSKPLGKNTDAEKYEEKKSFLYHSMGQKSLETYLAIVDFMSSKADSIIDDHYWYLSIVGIHPDYQGRGLGVPLIEKGLQTTDKLKVPTFLETFSQRNMTFYNRLGYKDVVSFFEPTAKAEYWIMTRDPA